MNIAVVSPDNRGTGVTSMAILIGAALKNKGEHPVVMSLNSGIDGLRDYVGDGVNVTEVNGGVKNISRLIDTGTLRAEDITNYCTDMGVDVLVGTGGISAGKVSELFDFMSKCTIDGKPLHTIVDVDIKDMTDRIVGSAIKAADVIVVVVTQSLEHLRHFKENRDNMMKAFGKKKVIVVVNRYDPFAGTMKNIWSRAGMKYGDGWYEVRYNKCVMLMAAKEYVQKVVTALADASDPDVASLKADVEKIAAAALKKK